MSWRYRRVLPSALLALAGILALVALRAQLERAVDDADMRNVSSARFRIVSESVVRDGSPSVIYSVGFQPKSAAVVGPKAN